MKIKLIDTFCTGVVHAQFNASLLAMLVMKYDLVYYYASRSSALSAMKIADKYVDNKTKYIPLFVFEGNGRVVSFVRYFIGAILNTFLLIKSSKSDILIYNFNNPLSLHLLNFVNSFLNRRVLVFCHGEMELLINSKYKGGLQQRLFMKIIRDFYLYEDRKMHLSFCVIGKSVYDNMTDILPYKICKVFGFIDHPYIYDNCNYTALNRDEINIGTVGFFSISKGGDQFVKLAKLLESRNPNVKLSITGKVVDDFEKVTHLKNVDLPRDKGLVPVPATEFMERIRKLDFVLFLYPISSYKLIASGAIMDAINWEKPILAIRNNYFEYLFSKYGSLGYLFNDINEIVDYLDSERFTKDFRNNKIDFANIKRLTSPECILAQLSIVLDKLN